LIYNKIIIYINDIQFNKGLIVYVIYVSIDIYIKLLLLNVLIFMNTDYVKFTLSLFIVLYIISIYNYSTFHMQWIKIIFADFILFGIILYEAEKYYCQVSY